jgi:L-methionine (R)-S-oxide reductase
MSTPEDRKRGRYERILAQLEIELAKCDEPISRMATAVAVLHHKQPSFFWTGFYRLVDGRLVVGPYQGSLACQQIDVGLGVCGTAVARDESIIVPDVSAFPGHIACDSRSRSEVVVPYHDSAGRVAGVLDVDSTDLEAFDEVDAKWLGRIVGRVYSK